MYYRQKRSTFCLCHLLGSKLTIQVNHSILLKIKKNRYYHKQYHMYYLKNKKNHIKSIATKIKRFDSLVNPQDVHQIERLMILKDKFEKLFISTSNIPKEQEPDMVQEEDLLETDDQVQEVKNLKRIIEESDFFQMPFFARFLLLIYTTCLQYYTIINKFSNCYLLFIYLTNLQQTEKWNKLLFNKTFQEDKELAEINSILNQNDLLAKDIKNGLNNYENICTYFDVDQTFGFYFESLEKEFVNLNYDILLEDFIHYRQIYLDHKTEILSQYQENINKSQNICIGCIRFLFTQEKQNIDHKFILGNFQDDPFIDCQKLQDYEEVWTAEKKTDYKKRLFIFLIVIYITYKLTFQGFLSKQFLFNANIVISQN